MQNNYFPKQNFIRSVHLFYIFKKNLFECQALEKMAGYYTSCILWVSPESKKVKKSKSYCYKNSLTSLMYPLKRYQGSLGVPKLDYETHYLTSDNKKQTNIVFVSTISLF